METLPNDNVFDMPITLLKFIGEAKRYTSLSLVAFRIFNCSALLLMISFICVNFLHVTSDKYIKTLQALVTVSHVLLKYTLFMYYKSDIENLLRDTIYSFKKYQEGHGNVNKRFGRVLRVIKYVQTAAIVGILLTVYLYMSRPLFNSNHSFILETFIPNSYALDAVLLMSHYYFLCVAMPVLLAYDFIYFALCIHVILQVRILKRNIACLPSNYNRSAMNQIGVCVKYHQTLLSIKDRMKIIYSAMLLFHYLVTIFTACIDLFLVIGNKDLTTIVIESLSLSFMFGQFACYTFPAEELATEFSDVSNIIYMLDWYSKGVTVQKLLLFIMANSQKVQYFSGFGLIDINVDAFGSVVRKSFSFYTIIRNLVGK